LTSPIFICIPTAAIGGAEKRFAGLWRFLNVRSDLDVRLVVKRKLLEVLQGLPELHPLPNSVVVYEVLGRQTPRAALRGVLTQLHTMHPTAVFHFVMISPFEVQRFRSRRTLFSEPTASLSLFNWKGRLASRLGALVSSKTDVLDESVLADFTSYLWHKPGAITLTPGSFVDLESYKPAPTQKDRFTFIGLFSETKQAFRLARALPVINEALKKAGIARPEFRFLGRETRTPGIAEILADMRGQVDAESMFELDPNRVLSESKVVFSLQNITNYPSKALLEGMASGALPVVTDVGSTRRIASPDFSEFVPRDFSANELADACLRVMRLDEATRRARVELMRHFLRQNFSIEAMAKYYEFHYRQLDRL
jgi:glycosyltransferase involved in cell wall biosynthesis